MGLLFERAKTGFLNPINSTVDKLMSASNGLMCLTNMAFGAVPNPASILAGLTSIATGLISSIVAAVTEVVTNRVNQIINSVLSPLRQIESIITDITKTLISVENILDKALNMDNYFKNKQNCGNMSAQLMNCLATSAINQITNKVAMNVDKHIGKIADSVSQKALGANGSISGFVNRHTAFIEKAQLQTKLLT